MRSRLSQNRRRQLRDWPSVEASLEHDRGRLTEFLLGTYAEFFARRGAGRATDLSRETMAAIAGLDDVLVVGAGRGGSSRSRSSGTPPHGADYLFNVSVPGGERHAVHLIWWAAQQLRALGVPRLNLGGGVRPGDDLAEFKRRFGAAELPLVSLRQVYRADVYDELCRAAGVTSDRDGWFPPYRAAAQHRGRLSTIGGHTRAAWRGSAAPPALASRLCSSARLTQLSASLRRRSRSCSGATRRPS